jgi:hypothetical protein
LLPWKFGVAIGKWICIYLYMYVFQGKPEVAFAVTLPLHVLSSKRRRIATLAMHATRDEQNVGCLPTRIVVSRHRFVVVLLHDSLHPKIIVQLVFKQ